MQLKTDIKEPGEYNKNQLQQNKTVIKCKNKIETNIKKIFK